VAARSGTRVAGS